MNLREERNFLDLPDSCVIVIKDLRRSSSSNTGFDMRKRTVAATPKSDLRKRTAAAVMEALMRLSVGRVSLGKNLRIVI